MDAGIFVDDCSFPISGGWCQRREIVNNCRLKAGSFALALHPRRIRAVWRVYGRPATNVDRSVHIGKGSVPARRAKERGLSTTVGFINMSTLRTFPRRVARIDKYNRYTGAGSLVGYERTQLCKGPAMQYRTLRPSSPDPRTNMREIFQRYPSLRALRP